MTTASRVDQTRIKEMWEIAPCGAADAEDLHARARGLCTAARYSNLGAQRPPQAGIDMRTGQHCSFATRTAPLVCNQKVRGSSPLSSTPGQGVF